ncbi:HAD-IIB family hydrolase [Mameliella alba]|uniref:HAD-IIB family hydrolase n=1 Tax=Mameliella alba TaxID=561184 RepID=UPI000B53815A|nr:HAD-IIB family hydrolase [Mameliella alba]MBY6118153.1 HAD-IIB family hydrolase [Mameliella alba]OWV42298.1 mannosyl-3-phosphoglycerate phosphatase [Mameliella alba]OWV56918.1 mannosyl-3-phosphoglycerate phosphatase [Mameliella alba]
MSKLVVFSDLDGTLLDHANYSFAPAQPALDALAARGIPLILATSKTAAEVAVLHEALSLGDWPAIVENGAGIYRPGSTTGDAAPYAALRAALDSLPPDLRAPFRGFGDMSDAEVAEITGLAPEAAALARQRQHSEPGLWRGSDATRDEFLAALADMGIATRSGGRFLTLSHGRTKADGLREIAAELGAERTLALGDAPNDTDMLQAADLGVIVRNDHGPGIPRLPGEGQGTIRRTADPGPIGWNTAVLAILNDIKD